MKQVFWFLCASILPALIGGSLASVSAQSTSPTPDPFIVQLTSLPGPTFQTVVSDVSANGRFVVFVSNGDVATQNRNNADGNREYQTRSESNTVAESDTYSKSNTNAKSVAIASSNSV